MFAVFNYLPLLCILAPVYATASISTDLRNAFEKVTNTTVGNLDKIIEKMYLESEANRDFQFKVPNNVDTKHYTMITMKRSDFVAPIFPNLTTNRFLMLMQKRRYTLKNSNHKEWSDFGLDGWLGELSRSYEDGGANNHNRNFEATIGAVELNYALQATEQSEEINNDTEDDFSLAEGDETVFIARANDPFGKSTMWPRRGQNASAERVKRDVIKLYSMIKCSTGCNPLSYKGYGCYCGFLGSGYPVDGIDRCCKFHDKCYEQSNCISYLEYFVPYLWKCYRGKPLCAFDHGEWGGRDSCAARLCYCDLQLSRCLRKFTCPRQRAVCRSSPARQLRNIFFRK